MVLHDLLIASVLIKLMHNAFTLFQIINALYVDLKVLWVTDTGHVSEPRWYQGASISVLIQPVSARPPSVLYCCLVEILGF